ncbi:hypothetical protein N7527_009170 [Penicillium freii]|nr:hypothetical protein N7527_009170 [Penicillium freii]
MSQSQQTEIGSFQWSECDSEQQVELDQLPSFTSSNCLSPFNSSFIQPSIASSVAPDPPEYFQRVGPGRKGQFFLYDKMDHSDWVNWWLQTDYGSNNKIPWESQHGSASETWTQFEQVAHVGTGVPKVMCKRCDQILEHPYSVKDINRKFSRHSTTTITRHLQTRGCQKALGIRQQKGQLKGFLRTGHPADQPFSQDTWENQLLKFITINRLPF